jgi:hypothetical protein
MDHQFAGTDEDMFADSPNQRKLAEWCRNPYDEVKVSAPTTLSEGSTVTLQNDSVVGEVVDHRPQPLPAVITKQYDLSAWRSATPSSGQVHIFHAISTDEPEHVDFKLNEDHMNLFFCKNRPTSSEGLEKISLGQMGSAFLDSKTNWIVLLQLRASRLGCNITSQTLDDKPPVQISVLWDDTVDALGISLTDRIHCKGVLQKTIFANEGEFGTDLNFRCHTTTGLAFVIEVLEAGFLLDSDAVVESDV